jgi:hypothetical protein
MDNPRKYFRPPTLFKKNRCYDCRDSSLSPFLAVSGTGILTNPAASPLKSPTLGSKG